VYYDMGFLASADVIECSATDLVGQYVGHTGPKTKGIFEKALGKVLFIDEAYRLSEGHFAKEAMDEIVGLMTNERFMNKLVIILAGYDNEMNALLGVNPGLSSRFSEEIYFQNMSSEQCLELLDKDLQKHYIIVSELADNTLPQNHEMQDIINQLSALPSWGNGRDVKTLGKRMIQKAFSNLVNGAESASLTAADALSILRAMLNEQQARQGATPIPSLISSPMASLSGPPPPPPSTSTSTSQSSKRAPSPSPPSSSRDQPRKRFKPPPPPQTSVQNPLAKPVASPRPAQRDAGVSDAVWNQLQADIAADMEEKRETVAEERELRRELKKAKNQVHGAKSRAASLERARREAKDDVEKLRQINRQLGKARRREALVNAARERATAALKKKLEEEAEKKRKEQKMQKMLAQMGVCPAGYHWIRQASGYRCAGGSHFMSSDELGM
jgi:hypothetical protein